MPGSALAAGGSSVPLLRVSGIGRHWLEMASQCCRCRERSRAGGASTGAPSPAWESRKWNSSIQESCRDTHSEGWAHGSSLRASGNPKPSCPGANTAWCSTSQAVTEPPWNAGNDSHIACPQLTTVIGAAWHQTLETMLKRQILAWTRH